MDIFSLINYKCIIIIIILVLFNILNKNYNLIKMNDNNNNNNNNYDNTIYFYDETGIKTKKEHIFLNNYDPAKFVANDNFTYITSEHYYQAHKFDDYDENPDHKAKFEEIRSKLTPDETKKLAHKYEKASDSKFNSKRWHDGYKETIMKKALIYKFSQNKDMLERLVQTGKAKLVEESNNDLYWGGLVDGSKNRLGDLLMELRDNYVKDGVIYIEGSGLEKIKF